MDTQDRLPAPDPWGLPAGSAPPAGAALADPPAPPGPEPEPERPAGGLRRFAGPLLALGALTLKFGKVALLALGKVKFLTTSLSMLVSVAVYALIFGWQFAVGLVALLFVHELGHAIQIKREGIPTSPILFVPLLGAVIGMKRMPDDAAAEARVGLAGPIVGSLAALALVPVWQATDAEIWQVLAFTGFYLNLFNLIPLSPLDGGRAMSALAPRMWFVGLFLVVLMMFVVTSPFLILIAVLGGFDVYHRWKKLKSGDPEQQRYYRVAPRDRLLIGLTYLALIAALAYGMDATYLERDFGDV